MPFATLGLSAEIARAVSEQGYTEPTPIQARSIPVVLAGRDLLAAAQTGTGKTAGFTLPLLERLRSMPRQRSPRVLVLTPTRELAAQVLESVQTYGKHLPFKAVAIFGGVGMQPQVQALQRGVEILIACPGRLLDHAERRTVDLSKIDILVLDEADRMLDMGFLPAVKRVLKLLPARRQNLLFSATFSEEIRQLAKGLLHDPVEVEVAKRNTAVAKISQVVHPVGQRSKRALLSHLISDGDWQQVLVFTRTKHGADRLAKQLAQDGLTTAALHGNKSQGARTQALRGFKTGAIRVLVATDIAARGLDIEALPHVVNYELPNVPEDYVHRIGRTGRAGAEGMACSLVSPDERKLLGGIQRLLKTDIQVQVVPGFEHDPNAEPEPAREAQPRRQGGRPGQPGAGERRPDNRPRRRGPRPQASR